MTIEIPRNYRKWSLILLISMTIPVVAFCGQSETTDQNKEMVCDANYNPLLREHFKLIEHENQSKSQLSNFAWAWLFNEARARELCSCPLGHLPYQSFLAENDLVPDVNLTEKIPGKEINAAATEYLGSDNFMEQRDIQKKAARDWYEWRFDNCQSELKEAYEEWLEDGNRVDDPNGKSRRLFFNLQRKALYIK